MSLFDVKTRFSEVVERVLREGRSITVTRRGQPVVDIVPSRALQSARLTREQARAALDELRRAVPAMDADEVRDLVHDGRRR